MHQFLASINLTSLPQGGRYLAPSILFGQAIGHRGNFINQKVHGGEGSCAFLESLLIPDRITNQIYIDVTYYHSRFLYESLRSLTGIIILLLLRKVSLIRGELFFFYIIWCSFDRFFTESIPTDSLYVVSGLRAAQLDHIGARVIYLQTCGA